MMHYYHADTTDIGTLMSQANSDFVNGVQSAESNGVPAQGQAGLAEVIQSFCGARRSGQLTFRSGASSGYVFLQQGQVVHAIAGAVEGEEAMYLMLSWAAGYYALNDEILPHKRTISSTWEQLLMEGARRADIGEILPDQLEPVITANPPTQTRAKDNQPKLIITYGDLPSQTVELQTEYSHLGRAEDNELPINEASISSRHCVFVLSGPDVIVRDLNSSNGTYVNGEPVAEAILRPGDNIQVGVIDIKFVPGVRRPKLQTATQPGLVSPKEPKMAPVSQAGTTLKLPEHQHRRTDLHTIDDSGADRPAVRPSSAISYEQLAPDGPKEKKSNSLIIVLAALIFLVVAGAVLYFVLLKH